MFGAQFVNGWADLRKGNVLYIALNVLEMDEVIAMRKKKETKSVLLEVLEKYLMLCKDQVNGPVGGFFNHLELSRMTKIVELQKMGNLFTPVGTVQQKIDFLNLTYMVSIPAVDKMETKRIL